MEKQALLNTYINNVTMPETIAAIEKMIADNKKSYVVAINVDVVMKIENDPYLKQVVDNADMVLVDGKPLVWISKLHVVSVHKGKCDDELCKTEMSKGHNTNGSMEISFFSTEDERKEYLNGTFTMNNEQFFHKFYNEDGTLKQR